jgi:hypothetical protein
LYLAFVDFAKDFDSVRRKRIWMRLRQMGVPDKIITIIKIMYENYVCCVSLNSKLSDPFPTWSGVRQGSLLSPLLFILVLDEVMEKLVSRRRRGIQWVMNKRLEDLEYVDDVCLLPNRFTDIKGKLNDLGKVSQAAELHLSKSKTKEMRIHNITDTRLQLVEEETEEVTECVYLGSIISKRGGSDEDITARIKKAKDTFSKLSPIWKSK